MGQKSYYDHVCNYDTILGKKSRYVVCCHIARRNKSITSISPPKYNIHPVSSQDTTSHAVSYAFTPSKSRTEDTLLLTTHSISTMLKMFYEQRHSSHLWSLDDGFQMQFCYVVYARPAEIIWPNYKTSNLLSRIFSSLSCSAFGSLDTCSKLRFLFTPVEWFVHTTCLRAARLGRWSCQVFVY